MPYLSEKDRARLRFICDNSFFHFCKIVGGYVHQGGDLSGYIHRPMADFISDRSIHRKANFMPRDWRKSTMGKWSDIYDYLHNHECRILIVSENLKLAGRFHDFIQHQLLRNAMLRWLYPEITSIDRAYTKSHKWNSIETVLPRDGIYSEATFTCIGVGGAAQSGHYTKIHLDDPVGKKAMESAIVLDGVLRWLDNMPELLVNPDPYSIDASDVLLSATFWGPGDAGNYIMEKYSPPFHFRITPCLKTSEVKDSEYVKWIQHPTQEDGETNYPENPAFSTEYYRDMMTGEKAAIFWTQHMNQPAKATGLTSFDSEWLRYYRLAKDDKDHRVLICEKESGGDGESVPLSFVPLYGLIDPGGFSDKKASKRSRLVVLIAGQEKGGTRKFVLYCWADRFKEPEKFLDVVFKAHADFHPRYWRVDVTGGASYIMGHLKQEAAKRGIRDFHISELPIDPTANSKDEGILALAEPMSQGDILVRREMNSLIAEVKAYPGGLTKDIVDMMGCMIRCGYWTRKKKSIMDNLFGNPDIDYSKGRSSVTGY